MMCILEEICERLSVAYPVRNPFEHSTQIAYESFPQRVSNGHITGRDPLELRYHHRGTWGSRLRAGYGVDPCGKAACTRSCGTRGRTPIYRECPE